MEKSKSCKESVPGRYFAGFVLLGLGILFLLTNWGIIPSLHRTWPLILIVIGLAFLLGLGGKREPSSETPSEEEEPKKE
jgi:hypothetical protein